VRLFRIIDQDVKSEMAAEKKSMKSEMAAEKKSMNEVFFLEMCSLFVL
jgi:hypothetical protein